MAQLTQPVNTSFNGILKVLYKFKEYDNFKLKDNYKISLVPEKDEHIGVYASDNYYISDLFSLMKSNKDEYKLDFNFQKASNEVVGVCPCCNEPVLDKGSFVACSKYKNGCEFAISKKIKDVEITMDDIKNLNLDDDQSWLILLMLFQ